MKVTQKEFVKAMTENATAFIGQTREIISVESVADYVAKYPTLEEKPEKRACKAYSKHLEFGANRSRLDLTGNTFGRYEFADADVYYCACSWIVCWYLIEK